MPYSAGNAQLQPTMMMKMMGEDGLFIISEGHENIEDIDIKEETGKDGEKRIEVRLKGKKN